MTHAIREGRATQPLLLHAVQFLIKRCANTFEADISVEPQPSRRSSYVEGSLWCMVSDWSSAWTIYRQISEKTGQNSRRFRDYLGRFLGYGLANVSKVLFCTEQRVTVLGVGTLEDGYAEEFSLPLPPSLSAKAENRRLTITLAWITPTNNKHQKLSGCPSLVQCKPSIIRSHELELTGTTTQCNVVHCSTRFSKGMKPYPIKTEKTSSSG